MHPALDELLWSLRRARCFDPASYVSAKCALLIDYLARGPVRAAVVGVSGGVDSAVTLGLLARARALPNSPLRRVVGALIPMFVREGATRQAEALALGRAVIEHFGAEPAQADLSAALECMRAATERALSIEGTAWAAGQLVSYLRTPALYHLTALLTEQGAPALVVGTTNRDEGAYLGFFGKASDGMVDLQLISDLHKSEVFALAAHLGVPPAVRAATPTGDTFDGRPDEAMIGATYEQVELHARLRETLEPAPLAARIAALPREAREEYQRFARAIEALHAHNAHKYWGGSPAVHLDVYPRGVPGGWSEEIPVFPSREGPSAAQRARFVAPFALDPVLVGSIEGATPAWLAQPRAVAHPAGVTTHGALLSRVEAALLREAVTAPARVAAGLDGRALRAPGDVVGSHRASTYAPALAAALWERLCTVVAPLRVHDEDVDPRIAGRRVFRAVGLNPLFRVLVYEPGGVLVPHFDEGFDAGDRRHFTLDSLVLALTDAPEDPTAGGATSVLLDPRRHEPCGERTYPDGLYDPGEVPAVLARVVPRAGHALLFDHRLRHAAERWQGPGLRVLLRTDVLYVACGHPRMFLSASAPTAVTAHAPTSPLEAKRLRDPYYRRLASLEAALAAGFFDDGLPAGPPVADDPRAQSRWCCTPVHKARARLAALRARDAGEERSARALVVVLATGAFCPLHAGHLAILERARAALEGDGCIVLAGYLSPSHDRYVREKCGVDAPSGALRVAQCEQAVAESDWLSVDPWEALHVDAAVNFTEVVARLERVMARQLDTARPVRVAYVFGGDNARFAWAFAPWGFAVCVARHGCDEELERVARDPVFLAQRRVYFCRAHATDVPLSSSKLRASESTAALPVRAGRACGRSLRDEGRWALEGFIASGRADGAALVAAYARFRDAVLAVLRDEHAPHAVSLRSLDDERRQIDAVRAGLKVLSLDPCIDGDVNLRVSRAFELASGDEYAPLVPRPGAPSIAAQLAELEPASYLLHDDDAATGETLRRVRAMLPVAVRIAAVHTSLEGAEVEACDLRDFLAGAREGGLVVAGAPGALARAPYLLPYARPSQRLRVAVERERAFSHRVWSLAARFFSDAGPALRVRDGEPAFWPLARDAGFALDDALATVCAWHAERLASAPEG